MLSWFRLQPVRGAVVPSGRGWQRNRCFAAAPTLDGLDQRRQKGYNGPFKGGRPFRRADRRAFRSNLEIGDKSINWQRSAGKGRIFLLAT